jgi:hypothetical protein
MASHRIHMLLDRSGSMGAYRDQTIEAVNAYLATLRADGLARDTAFNLTIFDSESIDTVRRDEPGWQVRNLEQREFVPRSATPLYDAVGHVLEMEGRISTSGRRAIVIVTDGAENGSRRLNEAAVREMAGGREAQGWIMIFLGANQNAAVEAAKVGVPAGRAIAYRAGSGKAAAATFAAAAALSFGYFMLKPGDANAASSLGFSEGDRQTAFDGAADWEAEMFKDMGSAPTEPAAGPSPATISEVPPTDADGGGDATGDVASQASESPTEAGDAGESGGSLLDTITGALGSLFSSFTGSSSNRDSGSDSGDDGGGDGGGD